MALCCIGGVCIPYSAIVPLLLYGLQWVLNKLAVAGLLPPAVGAALARFLPASSQQSVRSGSGSDCCRSSKGIGSSGSSSRRSKISKQYSSAGMTSRTTSCCSTISDDDEDHDKNALQTIDSEEELSSLLSSTTTSSRTDQTTVAILKFTASWCKPCQKIHPHYERLAREYGQKDNNENGNAVLSLQCAVVDADELDEAAARYKVFSLPTFVAICNGKVVDTYAGSDECQLQSWVERLVDKTK